MVSYRGGDDERELERETKVEKGLPFFPALTRPAWPSQIIFIFFYMGQNYPFVLY